MKAPKLLRKIFDRFGQPVQTEQLTEEHTARIEALHWEIASHPTRGLTPAKLAQILADAEQGDMIAQADLFEDMEEKDGHIFAELSKRRRSIMGLDWTIAPPRNPSAREKKAAVQLEEIVRDLENFEDVVFECTDAIGKGFSCQEISWDHSEGEWRPLDIDARPQRWFTVLPWDRNDLRLRDQVNPYGEELWPFGWVVHKHRAKSGYITRAAMFRVLAWPYLFKAFGARDLAEFLEIYGLPLRLGKYPSGASPSEKATLMRAVMGIGHNAGGIIPQSMQIDFQQAAEGSADPFKAMMEWCEATESKIIVGQTLTAQPGSRGGGSHAMAKVHDEVRWDITVSDAGQLGPTLSHQLVYPIGVLNGLIQDPKRAPRLVFDVSEVDDLGTYATALPALVKIGMQIPEKWAHERLGIPEPGDGDRLLQAPSPAPVPVAPAAARAALSGKAATEVPDPADLAADRLALEAQPHFGQWMTQIEAMLEQADSLEQFREMLLSAFGDLPAGELGALFGHAMAAVDAAGRFDVEQSGAD